MRLWDVATGNELRVFRGDWFVASHGCFSPDGRRALVSGAKAIHLLDLDNGKELRQFRTYTGTVGVVTSLACCPDGRRAIAGMGSFGDKKDFTLRLWDLETGEELRRFEGHNDDVTCVLVLPNGRVVASGSRDRTVRLWDIETAKQLHRFDGYTEEVTSLAVSPDIRYLLSGSSDKTVRLWRLPALPGTEPRAPAGADVPIGKTAAGEAA